MAVVPANEQSITTAQGFAHIQRVAQALAASTIVPADYQNNLPNVIVALEMSNRMGISPMMVMQNLDIIHGKPSWKSTFIISAINSCGRFEGLQFELSGEGDQYGCVAWTRNRNGDVIRGPRVSIGMARSEGWFTRKGTKWNSMPELMLQYRAASFFGRLHCPDILMGMQSVEEVQDVTITTTAPSSIQQLNASVKTPIVVEQPSAQQGAENAQPSGGGGIDDDIPA
jgi:hypothetical protein